jgi:ribosomal protein L34E
LAAEPFPHGTLVWLTSGQRPLLAHCGLHGVHTGKNIQRASRKERHVRRDLGFYGCRRPVISRRLLTPYL